MKLRDFLRLEKKTIAEFSNESGVDYDTLKKHIYKERHPSRNIMRQYFIATKGKVTPNDFYNFADEITK